MSRPARPYWPHNEPEPASDLEPPAPSNGPCSHWCNSKWRNAVKAYDEAVKKWGARGCTGQKPQPTELEPWPGEPNICRKCGTVVRGALRELPKAYDALASVKFLTRSASADDERRGRSDVPASPSSGADHQDEILSFTRDWEDALRRHLGHQAATDVFGDPRATLTASVEYLNANYGEILVWDYDLTGEFAKDIHAAYSTAVAMCKNKPVRKHLPTPCPSPGCGYKALIQEEGVAGKPWYVECSERLGGCGRLYGENDWSWFSELLVKGHVQIPMVPVDQ